MLQKQQGNVGLWKDKSVMMNETIELDCTSPLSSLRGLCSMAGKVGVHNQVKSFLGDNNNHGLGALLFCSYNFITFVILSPHTCFPNLGSFAFSFKYVFV